MISAKAFAAAAVRPVVQRDLADLAPAFRQAVEAALEECHAEGLDAYVYEARRTNEVQEAYYALGRTEIPPSYTVTNAKSAMGSWHFYGLAVDVISKSRGWFNDDYQEGLRWFRRVAAIFKKHGCDWGGDWKTADLPHFQWGRLRPSPSARARALYAAGGRTAVWEEVGALQPNPVTVDVPRVEPSVSPEPPTRHEIRKPR